MNRNEGPDLGFSRLCVQQSTAGIAEHSRHSRQSTAEQSTAGTAGIAQQSRAQQSTGEQSRSLPKNAIYVYIYICLSAHPVHHSLQKVLFV